MTALCGGGASNPKPDAPTNELIFSAAALDFLLGANGLGALIPFIAPLEYPLVNLSTFCATDPPALPTGAQLAADLVCLANFTDPTCKQGAYNDLIAVIDWLVWYQYCTCASGSPTPIATPVVTLPTTAPVQVDGSAGFCVATSPSACKVLNLWNGTTNVTPPSGWDQLTFDDSSWPQANPNVVFDTTNGVPGTLIGVAGGTNLNCAPGLSCPPQMIAPWVTPATGKEEFLVRWRFQMPANFDPEQVCVQFYDDYGFPGSGGWSTGTETLNGTTQIIFTSSLNWHGATSKLVAGNNLLAIYVNSSNTSAVNTWGPRGSIGMTISQAGSIGGGAAQGCCPPDPMLMRTLNQLLTVVTSLNTNLTLIQRQAAPFGYVPGATSTGLSGSGTLTVSDILGLSVTVTARPSAVGIEAGTPQTLYGVGWVRACTADGCGQRHFVDASPWTSFDPMYGVATAIDYSFEPGVTATIETLVHEP